MTENPDGVVCATCGKTCVQPPPAGVPQAAGYGRDSCGRPICYECAGKLDSASMQRTGRAALYLIAEDGRACEVVNWPGSLRFSPVRVLRRWMERGFYGAPIENVAIRFVGPDGAVWSGRGRGDNMIVRCRRTRLRSLDD